MTDYDPELHGELSRIADLTLPPTDAITLIMKRLHRERRRRRVISAAAAVVGVASIATGAYAITNQHPDATTHVVVDVPTSNPTRPAPTQSTASPLCKATTFGISDHAPHAPGSATILKAVAPYLSLSYPLAKPGDHAQVIDAHPRRADAVIRQDDGSVRMLLTLIHNRRGWLIDTLKDCDTRHK